MSTVVIYHIDDEETPYRTKLFVSGDQVTLADFKGALNLPRNYKFFFKSEDADFGLGFKLILNNLLNVFEVINNVFSVVKEEIIEDRGRLPLLNGRVEAWVQVFKIFLLKRFIYAFFPHFLAGNR